MGARQKLNGAVFNGALVLGAVAGYWAGSWLVFAAVTAAVLVVGLVAGELRPGSCGREPAGRDTPADLRPRPR